MIEEMNDGERKNGGLEDFEERAKSPPRRNQAREEGEGRR